MITRIVRCLFVASLVVALAIGPSRAANLVTLYSFCAQTNGAGTCTDGETPGAGLIADANGDLFSTTEFGGKNGLGTVFEITKTANGYATTPTILYSFCPPSNSSVPCPDGANPFAGLLADANGDLFGTTAAGGANGGGTVFELAKSTTSATGYATTLTILYSFCAQANCTDGESPFAGLIADAAGDLFGTTRTGGTNGGGTVFELAKSATSATGYATTPTVLYSFCAQTNCTDGELPAAGLILDAAGNLFGTTEAGGGNGEGTVFEIAKSITSATGYAPTPTTLYSFCAQPNCTDGADPHAGLIADAKGNLFGTTEGGGANGEGTVFEIAKNAGGYATTPTILYSFCAQKNSSGICTDGNAPVAGLIADANGDLFGTTLFGGPNATGGGSAPGGTVFEIAKSATSATGYATTPTILHSFCAQTNSSAACTDGANPLAGLIADPHGDLFGTSEVGGANGRGGTVFEVTFFAGTPGRANCIGKSVSALAQQYGGLANAAATLGYSSVLVLQNAIASYCAG